MDAIFLRNLCRLFISSALVLCSGQVFAQNFTWVPNDSAWTGVNGNNWTLRARTGIVTDSGRYFLTDYFVNDKIKGYLEYLPNDYEKNTTTKYPVIIYFPGCGEIHNGKMYLHGKNGTPNYYYGIGRFFAEGNPPPVDVRVNAGGASQNYDGERWWAETIEEYKKINLIDTPVGVGTTYTTANNISGTGGKLELYQSGRQGSSLGFNLPARDPGQYLLKLYFAETTLTAPGNVFNVTAEGNPILTNFDIHAAAGGHDKAYVYQTTVTVNDGKLDLNFSATGGNVAKISAIELTWNVPVAAKDGFESLPTWLRDQGQYFSNIPLKTLGQNYPASGGPTQGVIVLCMMQSGEPVLCGETSSVVGNPDVQAALDIAFRKYRVDPTRVYLTGMSAGGGVAYSFPGASLTNAKTLAAVAPIAAVNTILGNTTEGSNIINGGTAVLAVANIHDFNTNGSGANAYDNNVQAINNLNSFTPIVPRQVTFYEFTNTWQEYDPNAVPAQNPDDFPKRHHDGWQRAYRWQNPGWDTRPAVFVDTPASGTPEKYTLYEWFLLNQNLASPLPVLLTEFTATRVNGAVELDWKTSTEINSSYFTLERSVDGTNFSALAKIDAAGNSVTEKKYRYTDDKLPGSAYVYYRLSQTDKDGKKQIFGIRKVFIGSNGFELKVFPTLTTGTLNIEIQGVSSDPINVRVVDLSGKVLMQQQIAPRANRVSMNVNRLAKGMYVLQADNSVHRFTTKFIKQ